MKTEDYRKWIEAGYKNYGTDPWFFLRELAQNSRDAGASGIQVAARNEGNVEHIVFQDNGCGMTYEHAVNYLFRLYASSKLKDRYSAGMFGIGFWTILKFNPALIYIESTQNGAGWAVTVDSRLESAPAACRLSPRENGTRITLSRPSTGHSPQAFIQEVENALSGYCRYLRRNTRQAESLPVFFNGRSLSQPMTLPGPLTHHFRKGPVEGVVGLGPAPRVFLYARGLPVWEGASLEELSSIPSPKKRTGAEPAAIAHGLAPVFLLNGDHLEVNISRRRAIDNRSLEQVRKLADQALSELVELAADTVSHPQPLRRLAGKIRKKLQPVFSSFWKTLLLLTLLIIPLEYFLLKLILSGRQTPAPSRPISLKIENNRYSGAAVQPAPGKSAPPIAYSPPSTTWFKLYHVESYLPTMGFVEAAPPESRSAVALPPLSHNDRSITISLNLRETGEMMLPVPLGFSPDPASIRLNNTVSLAIQQDSAGAVRTRIPDGVNGILQYFCRPIADASPPPTTEQRRFLQIPRDVRFPPNVETALRHSQKDDPVRKLETVLQLISEIATYDDSEATARKYEHKQTNDDWLAFVLSTGAGDCDVINGIAVLMLRRLDIPARLAVGLVGENGVIRPGMHAWLEYFHEGWRPADATLYTPTAPGGSAGTILPTPPELTPNHQFPRDASPRLTRDAISSSPATLPAPASPSSQTPVNASNNPRPPTKKPLPSPHSRFFTPWMAAAVLFIIGTSLAIIFRRRNRKTAKPFVPPGREKVLENLARMALHWLLHPHVWGEDAGVGHVRILPALNHRNISLSQAIKLSEKGKLFHLDGRRPWACLLAGSSIPVLETGFPSFDPLIKIIPGAVNLTAIADLQTGDFSARPWSADAQETDGLLKAVSTLLGIPCLPAPGLHSQAFFDVSFPRDAAFRSLSLPRRFIAVNIQSEFFRQMLAIHRENPRLGAFRMLKAVLDETSLRTSPPGRLLEKAAKRLLQQEAF